MSSVREAIAQAGSAIDLFAPVALGPYQLPNRMVMAPLTRNRAGAGNVPHALNVRYYEQRASAGLIITEATQVSLQGVGYPNTPGIHSREQIEGWKLVTRAVHARGGRIFLQLWHVGRISHPSLQPNGELPVAPSAIKPEGQAFTATGLQPFVTPRALETREISGIVEQFRQGAINALAAGFDGVEIHAANGYLIDQFLRSGSNQRTDQYGGTLENRARLLSEIAHAVAPVWGANRVGVRLSPVGGFNDMADSNPQQTFEYVAEKLNFGLAYLHVVEMGAESANPPFDFAALRKTFNGTYIANTGYTKARANATLARGDADLVAFGSLFLANPDLPLRFAIDAALNTPDQATFYGGAEKGYTDYPFLMAAVDHENLHRPVEIAASQSTGR
jgi:N-ethylmaleimide reductase